MQGNREETSAVAAFMNGARVREKNPCAFQDPAAGTGPDREMPARIENHGFIPPAATLVKLAGAPARAFAAVWTKS